VSRPGCSEIADYRAHVDEAMGRLLNGPLDERSEFLAELGLHHEQQHQELLLQDIKHVLSASPLDPVYLPAAAASTGDGETTGARPGWITHPGGLVTVGHDGAGFAFDNESPAHGVHLEPFAVSDRLVTCGEWIDFMADGGYRRPELWLSDGWAQVQAEGWDSPLYWRQEDGHGGHWSVFSLHGRRPVDRSEPVCHISYYEADAFASWSGKRLPTEAEWEAVASSWPLHGQFLDVGALHPAPETAPSMFGGVWVWTSSAYSPYPGFHPAEGAVGEYNGKFMVSQQVLRGGSCVTPDGHARTTYRNFYPPPARWPFTGLRLAKDLEGDRRR
jgi:ergothioneine biosynthesis protein EgtB